MKYFLKNLSENINNSIFFTLLNRHWKNTKKYPNFNDILSNQNLEKYDYIFIWHHHGYCGLMEIQDEILEQKKRLQSLGHSLKVITTIREVISYNTSRVNYLRNECGNKDLTKEKYLKNNLHTNIQTKYFMYNIFGEHLYEKLDKDIIEKVSKTEKNDIINLSSIVDLFIETKSINIFKEKILKLLNLDISYYKHNLNKGVTKECRKIKFDDCKELLKKKNNLDCYLIEYYKNTKYMNIDDFIEHF